MVIPKTYGNRLCVYAVDPVDVHDSFARDVQTGLCRRPKTIPAKYFYDARGSRLYEQICELPEYYPYRAEREILIAHASEIHHEIAPLPLVELGSGTAAKTRFLLAQYENTGRPFLYCPVDIAPSVLMASADRLLAEFPHLSVRALHTDFAMQPEAIQTLRLGAKAVAFFGSSLGNFTHAESVDFLRRLAATMGPQDLFLLGIDLKKSADILIPAYDDAQGVTAAFNLNILYRANAELGANFDLKSFQHVALYNEKCGRIEMHLRSRRAQQVTIAKIGQTVRFGPGETIHTENSYKYSVAEVRDLGRRAGLDLHRTWFDSRHYFMVGLFRRCSA